MSDAVAHTPLQKLLLLTRNLPPLTGGMERLNLHLALESSAEFDVVVVGPRGCGVHLSPGILQICEVPHKPLWQFLFAALVHGVRLAREYRPACILAGSGLTAPVAFIAAKLVGARSVAYVHGLDLIVRHPIYRFIWHPFLRRMHLCIANSHHTAGLAESIGIPERRIAVLNPGVDSPDNATQHSAAEFRTHYRLEARKILLSVGRMTPRKGLLQFVDQALPLIVERDPLATLVVVGDEAPDALAGTGHGLREQILESARRAGLEENVRLLGRCDDAMLSAAYRASDMLVFPVRRVRGDVEGFGMVALEAASYGLPTVAFSVGGVTDSVSEGQSGWLIAPDDYQAMADRIMQVLVGGHNDDIRGRCRAFAAAFDWRRFGERLRALLNQLCRQD